MNRLRAVLAQASRFKALGAILTIIRLAGLVGMVWLMVHGWMTQFWLSAVCLIGTKADRAWIQHLRKATIDVAELQDIRTLDLLLEAWNVGEAPVRQAASRGLVKILPQLTLEHRGALSTREVENITDLLSRFEPDLIHAALAALEHVGNEQSLIKMRSVLGIVRLGGASDGKNRNDITLARWAKSFPHLMEHGRLVAASLEARLEEERQHALLLRPADGGADTLLRPATSQNADAPQNLLRVVAHNSAEDRQEE